MSNGGPRRVDGVGTRRNPAHPADTTKPISLLNAHDPVKEVRLFASEAITKGDLVAFDFAATEPANGYGNHIKICDQDDALNAHGIGIAAEAIASGDLGLVQVAGVCTFAKVDESAVADGQLLGRSPDAGLLDLFDTSGNPDVGGDDMAVAVCIKKAADDTASSTVYLLNPANL